MLPLRLTDSFVQQLVSEIAVHTPERGAVGVGPCGHWLLTSLIPDPWAVTTSVSYIPSARVTAELQRVERGGAAELKLIVHSHPGRFDELSGPDLAALASTLACNPHLACIAAPIVTLGHPIPKGMETPANVIALPGNARATFYGAIRGERRQDLSRSGHSREWRESANPSQNAPIEIFPWPVRVVPLERQLAEFADRLAAATGTTPVAPGIQVAQIDGVSMMTATLEGSFGDWIFLIPGDYPWAAPTALRTLPDGDTESVPMRWPTGSTADDALWQAIGGMPPKPARKVPRRLKPAPRRLSAAGPAKPLVRKSATDPVPRASGKGNRRFLICREFQVEIPASGGSR